MRILFVTPYVPSHARIRPLAFIRTLAQHGHQVHLVCLLQPAHEEKFLREVTPYCAQVTPVRLDGMKPILRAFASLPTSTPLSVAYCQVPAVKDTVNRVAQNNSIDLIHTEFIRAAPFTQNFEGLPKVFDCVDSLTLTYRRSLEAKHISPGQRLVSLFEWVKMRSYERKTIAQFDRVIISSPADRNLLNSSQTPIEVVPNGVDTEYFAYYSGSRPPCSLVFVGKMSYYVNVASILWFAKEVLPIIKSEFPEIKLTIVGRDPIKSVTALSANPAITVTGTVPDVRPFLSASTVSICPMVSGGGIQNKLLEAMANGVPAVATTIATQALSARAGIDLMIADTHTQFADQVMNLLRDSQKRIELAKNGRHYVEKNHSWPEIGQILLHIYDSLSPIKLNLEADFA